MERVGLDKNFATKGYLEEDQASYHFLNTVISAALNQRIIFRHNCFCDDFLIAIPLFSKNGSWLDVS